MSKILARDANGDPINKGDIVTWDFNGKDYKVIENYAKGHEPWWLMMRGVEDGAWMGGVGRDVRLKTQAEEMMR